MIVTVIAAIVLLVLGNLAFAKADDRVEAFGGGICVGVGLSLFVVFLIDIM